MGKPVLLTAGGTPSPAGGPEGRQTRRPYHTSDLRFVQQHYPHQPAAKIAQQLGRSVGSIRNLIFRFQLQKQNCP